MIVPIIAVAYGLGALWYRSRFKAKLVYKAGQPPPGQAEYKRPSIGETIVWPYSYVRNHISLGK